MPSTVTLPNGKDVPVRTIKEMTWGELEDLEELSEEMAKPDARRIRTIKRMFGILLPSLADEDRRSLTAEQVNQLLVDANRVAQQDGAAEVEGPSEGGKD